MTRPACYGEKVVSFKSPKWQKLGLDGRVDLLGPIYSPAQLLSLGSRWEGKHNMRPLPAVPEGDPDVPDVEPGAL